MTQKPETLCTGCGATVTQDSELYWRDSGGYKSCSPATGSTGLHRIEEELPPVAIKTSTHCPTCDSPSPKLHPAVQNEGEVYLCHDSFHAPVAIKPPTSIRELANKIMQACIDSPTKFLGESIETILRAEFEAVQPQAKREVSEPTPGSVWVLEKETVRFIKIATEGRNCTSIAIDKSDGSVLSVELRSWIGEDSKPMVQA